VAGGNENVEVRVNGASRAWRAALTLKTKKLAPAMWHHRLKRRRREIWRNVKIGVSVMSVAVINVKT
jgi:RNase P protein component